MEKRKKVAVLPTKLVKEIESLEISPLQKERAFKAVRLILKRCLKKEGGSDRFASMPVKYWKKALCEHYERVLKPLEFNGIVERLKSYSTLWNVSKKCRVNPELLNDNLQKVTYYDDKVEKDNSYVCKQTRKVLRALHLDLKSANADVEDYISTLGFLEKVKFDNQISNCENLPVYSMQKDGVWRKRYYSKAVALVYASISALVIGGRLKGSGIGIFTQISQKLMAA
jgi:hypothetical protein